MNSSFSYEAKKRIADMGAEAISEFLEEAPIAARRKVLSALPTIDGFRKNTDREFKKKSERLVAALAHAPDPKSRASSKEWNAFAAIWCAWGQDTFHCTFPATLIDYKADVEEGALSFLHKLVDRAPDGCSREDVEKLVQFSGFAITSDVSAFVAALPTRVTLVRDRTLSRLPADVKALEQSIVELERTTNDFGRQLRLVSSEASSAATTARVASEASAEASRKLSEMERRSPVVTSADMEKLSGQLANEAEQLERRLEQKLKATQTSKESVNHDIDTLQKALKKLTADLAEMRTSLKVAEERYQRAVDESKIQLETISEQKIEVATHREIANGKAIAGSVKWMSPEVPSKPEKLADASTIFQFAKDNFLAIGIRQTDADSVARTMVAGVLSGHMVQFRGSLAEFIAIASARCLGGQRLLSWQVPLGLYDGTDADGLLQLLGDSSLHYPGVLLRGVNRSAFEIYGGAVRDLVLQSQFVRSGRLPLRSAMFATWVDGPATLPGNTALLELGPVIDADELMWSHASDWTAMRCGELSFLLDEIHELIDGSKEQVSEVFNVVNALKLPRNRLWQFAFSKYLGVLFALPGSDYKRDLATALAHWVVPWAHVNGLSREKVEHAIGEFASEQLQMVSVKNALSELAGEAIA
ncbi:hypothetical protein [Burkholderia pseudomallei]|uniref:hypothetical protein n=1 Tax=Burkholderia pseudomallei TaxID=28450 RepID=UPI001AD78B07|nr:hypothetical protein [Burkholderia pseudomallei]MBO7822130.1 hypothetical protein [Burkholderia pseudomallei]